MRALYRSGARRASGLRAAPRAQGNCLTLESAGEYSSCWFVNTSKEAMMPGRSLGVTAFLAGVILVVVGAAHGQAVAPTPERDGLSMYDLYAQGGWVMHVISAFSIFALLLGVWFSIVLRPKHIISEEFVRKVWSLLSDGNVSDAYVLCERVSGMVPRLFLAGLKRAGAPAQQLQRALEAAGEREAARLARNVRYLSEIATLTPMLGLLGTVLGLIESFSRIAADPAMRQPDLVAVGVYKAMVTTAWGLLVAIPAMALFYYFRARVQHIMLVLEQLAEELADKLLAQPSRWESRKP